MDHIELGGEGGTRGQAQQNIPVPQDQHMTDYLFNHTRDLLRETGLSGGPAGPVTVSRRCHGPFTPPPSGCRRSTEIHTQ